MKRLRALALAGLAVLATVELIWLAGANWALSSGYAEARINRRPDRLQVEWVGAHSLIPGLISVRGVTARGQNRMQQFYAQVDRARVRLSLVGLARKRIRTYSVKAYGVDFRLRKRLAEIEAPPLAPHWPEIPGLAIDAPFQPLGRRAGQRPWVFDIRGIRVDGIKQAWLMPDRIVARGTVRGNLWAEQWGPVTVDRLVGALQGAEVSSRGQPVAHDLTLDFEAKVDPFVPTEVRGFAVWKSISGSLSLAGRTTTPGLLNLILASFGPIEVGDTGGAIDGRLLVGQGKLLAGSRLDLRPEGGWLAFLDWRAAGGIDARFEVREATETHPGLLTLSLAGVEVVDRKIELPVLEDASVEVAAALADLDLTRGIPGLVAAATSIELDLTGATVADITRFPLPPVEDFSLDSGRIEVEGRIVADRIAARGSLRATGTGIGATYGEVALTGDLEIELNMATGDMASREFTLADSTMTIDNVTIDGTGEAQKDWYARLDIRQGDLSLLEPRRIGGAFDLRMRDSRPIIALLQHRRPRIRRLEGLLDFSDLDGTASVSAEAGGLVVHEVDVTGSGLHLMTRLQVADREVTGLVYCRFRGLPFAIDLRGDKAVAHLARPKKWFEAQSLGSE